MVIHQTHPKFPGTFQTAWGVLQDTIRSMTELTNPGRLVFERKPPSDRKVG